MANTNFKAYDPATKTFRDLDDMYITNDYLVDRFVGTAMYAGGVNNYGETGNGIPGPTTSGMAQIGADVRWVNFGIGTAVSAGVKSDGTLWMMGYGGYGGLGNGATANYSSPIQVGALTTWSSVCTNGMSTLALERGSNWGKLWAWGYNGSGQLGNGNTVDYSSPVQVGSLTTWASISQQPGHFPTFHAIKFDGTLWGWGANTYGQIGNGTSDPYTSSTEYSSPIQIGSLTNWSKVYSTSYSTFAIKTDGTLWGWGRNVFGQLGNGTTVDYSSPVQIGTLSDWKMVCSTNNTAFPQKAATFGIKTDGTLWAWGSNQAQYILGIGVANSDVSYSSPVQVGALSNWKHVTGGQFSTFGVKKDGTLWGWGYIGRIVTPASIQSSPVQIGALNTWKTAHTIYNGTENHSVFLLQTNLS